ncbi:HAD family hydrolase [Patulibacter minatonensis]|uniref:HAD family hydrolase n=1 Tax=Patulibacter minatonensis TaxID=298163 RepID=UPI00047E2E37|nr:beta-phosphoglucomutase family hydrolase [Patulibacter minatonensis]
MAGPRDLGEIDAYLFDMDGVLTDTARLHAAAWKSMFDDVLRTTASGGGPAFVPFDTRMDYERHVDGRPRLDGIRSFLASRGIAPPGDGTEEERIVALGDRKNALLRESIDAGGIVVYPDARTTLEAIRGAGVRTALVSSSANAERILELSGTRGLFDVVVSGADLVPRGLRGKPAPDSYLAAAADLSVDHARAAVVEDAVSGVTAGRDGAFGMVIGVNRHAPDHADALRAAGADLVVSRLTDLNLTIGGHS